MKKVNWKDLDRGDLISGFFAAAIFVGVFGVLNNWLSGFLFGLITFYATATTRHVYVAALRKRVDSTDSVIWDVLLNDVKVGTIPDSHYAAIRLKVFTDLRNYVSQMLNLGCVAMCIANWLFIALPITVFWCVIAAVIVAPDTLAIVMNELRSATSAQLGDYARMCIWMLVFVGVLSAFVNASLTGARYGFVNRFSEDTNRSLRHRLHIAAEGDLELFGWVNGFLRVNDERDALKAEA